MKKKGLLIVSFCFVLLSCGTFKFNDTKGAQLIASMDNEKLYLRDIECAESDRRRFCGDH
ncbi:MAG: hypothetical protein RR550_01480 [Rikenellaceae bacterium]